MIHLSQDATAADLPPLNAVRWNLTLPPSIQLAAPLKPRTAPTATAAPPGPVRYLWDAVRGQDAVEHLAEVFDGRDLRNLAAPSVDGPSAAPGPAPFVSDGLSRVALLASPMEALRARAALMSGAKRSIYAGYFAFFPDDVGLPTLERLREAARRGLKVRLMVDSWGNALPKAMLKHLMEEGVEVGLYHPFRLGRPLSWLWRRAHDKWTVVDGSKMIIGNRNMHVHYFGMGPGPQINREAFVSGPSAAKTQQYAESLWDSGRLEAPRGLRRVSAFDVAKAGRRLDRIARHPHLRRDRADGDLQPWSRRAREAPARFSKNSLDRNAGAGEDLLRMIRGARRSVVIDNGYVALPGIFRRELEKAVRRGVRVVVVTNSYANNNLFSVRQAYEADVPALVRMGVELYEFGGPALLHMKNMVADGMQSYVGAFNLDPRSLNLNTETGVIVHDPGFAGDLLSQIERLRRVSTLVADKGRWVIPRRRRPFLSPLADLLRRLALLPLRWLI